MIARLLAKPKGLETAPAGPCTGIKIFDENNPMHSPTTLEAAVSDLKRIPQDRALRNFLSAC
jgi:hypothetical protein